MAPYRVTTGHGNILTDTEFINPEPSGSFPESVEVKYALSGATYHEGSSFILHWDMIETEAEYQAMLEQFGLDVADYADVTVYIRGKRSAFKLYNAVAHLPEPETDIKWSNVFMRNVNLILTHLEETPEI